MSTPTPELDYSRDRMSTNHYKTPSPVPGRKVDDMMPVTFTHLDGVVPARVTRVLPLGHLSLWIDDDMVTPPSEEDGE